MNEKEIFILADRALLDVVKQIKDSQLDMKLPEWFHRNKTQDDATLGMILNYHAYDEAWIPDMLAGRTMEEVGVEAYKGDLLGTDPIGSYSDFSAKAIDSVRKLDDLERTVHCSFGDYTAQQFLWQANSFRGFRAYDIAKLIGVDTSLSPVLVKGLWEELSPHFDEWRSIGVFPAAIEIAEDADLQSKLLAASGRQP